MVSMEPTSSPCSPPTLPDERVFRGPPPHCNPYPTSGPLTQLTCPAHPLCFHIHGASSVQGLGLQMHMPHTGSSFPGLSSCSLCSYFLLLSFLRCPGATSAWLSLFISSAVFFGSSVSCCSASGILWGSSLLPHQGQVCFFFNFYFTLEYS